MWFLNILLQVVCVPSKDLLNKNITVSVICNVSQVPLFESAQKISGYYEEAYKKFIKFSSNINPHWSAATDENSAKIVDELQKLTAECEWCTIQDFCCKVLYCSFYQYKFTIFNSFEKGIDTGLYKCNVLYTCNFADTKNAVCD